MSDETTRLTHKPLLDGVRGVLMSAVVGYHLGGTFRLPGGWVAMDLFFVLSGYLITTLLVKEHASTGRVHLGTFYRRRVRRLAPSLLVVLAAVFAAVWTQGWAEDFPNLRGDGLSTLAYVANWHFIWSEQSYFTSFQPSPLRHTWSLAIEEQFYLLWPIMFVALARLLRGNRRALAGLLVAAALGSAWWMRHLVIGGAGLSRAYYGTDTRAQGLLVGAFLALLLWPDRWETPKGRLAGSVIGTAGAVTLALMMVRFHDDSAAVYTRFGFVAICVACAALVFGAVRATSGPLRWIFGNPLTCHLGHISYVAYLWHWPVIVLVAPPRFDLSPDRARLVQLAVSLLLAEVTHLLIEDPIHRRRIQFRFDSGALAAAAAAVLALVLLLPSASLPLPSKPPPSGRRAGGNRAAAERVLLVGDSTAWVAAALAPEDLPFRLDSVFRPNCDVVAAEVFTGDELMPEDPKCPQWKSEWARASAADPDVVIVSVGLRQMFDISVDGRRVKVGTAEWEQLYRAGIGRAVGVIRSETAAPILWIEVPCFRWSESGSRGEEEDPERVETVNRVLADELAGFPDVSVVPFRKWVCPDGSVDRKLRPDGAHLDAGGVAALWHRRLVPMVREVMAS